MTRYHKLPLKPYFNDSIRISVGEVLRSNQSTEFRIDVVFLGNAARKRIFKFN